MTINIYIIIASIFLGLALLWTIILIFERFSIDPVPMAKKRRLKRVLVSDVIFALVFLLVGVFLG
ncbi:MAG: hypothetical protein K9K93_05015 [Acholeplasmataceae bacterium]|nr:hypothetical protein [Acholeplasmataceae bacterium]